MKATVLAIFIVICRLQQCPLTVARQVSLSFLLVNIFLSFHLSRFSFYINKITKLYSPSTASPRNSNRWQQSVSLFGEYDACVRDCSKQLLSLNLYPILRSKTSQPSKSLCSSASGLLTFLNKGDLGAFNVPYFIYKNNSALMLRNIIFENSFF